MRKSLCVPMIALFLLTGCTGAEEETDFLAPYREMEQCTMEARLTCSQGEALWEAELACTYVPDGASEVEVLAPERLAGVKATLKGETLRLEYEDLCLDALPLSRERISPVQGLPIFMEALRSGWLMEENDEEWQEVPCRRLTLDQTGPEGGKLLSTLWLRRDDGTPLRGELAVDGEIILTAEFTAFSFCDTINT